MLSVVCIVLSTKSARHDKESKYFGLTGRRVSPQQILTTVMTRIVVDNSTNSAKPQGFLFSEPELKKPLRDTSMRTALSGLLSTTAN